LLVVSVNKSTLIITKSGSLWNKFLNSTYQIMTVKKLGVYFTILNVSFHEVNAIFGFVIMITMIFQLISGVMLSFSLVTDPMLIPVVRDEEDIEDMYTDDFFWLHERGVDLIFIFSYFHLFRKLYIHAYDYEHEATWKSGVFSFMVFQVVVFFGLALCCTHLSEITLTIAANVMCTFTFFFGKFYWWLFTDKQLCADTLVRIAYGHYVIAFYLFYASFIHTIDMHYDWKNETSMDGMKANMVWWDETFLNELSLAKDLIIFFFCLNWMLLCDPEAATYENFMWGDIGLVTDVRFYGVAPHWYFRPFMAWLIICPQHKTGIFGLLLFFFLLFFQPLLHGSNEQNDYYSRSFTFLAKRADRDSIPFNSYVLPENNMYTMYTLYFFVMSCLYTTTYLPYGRFYNRINGNQSSIMHFMYIFSYLQFTFLRTPFTLESIRVEMWRMSRPFWR
jgi:quinol-cytochrome oxidoreductase complex cytochrome b subunit